MAGASFLWRRGTAYWFQIAVPKDLSIALGATPLRIRLPARSRGDASRYARVLAGIVEQWFTRMRLSPIAELNLAKGDLSDARERLLKVMTDEIQEIMAIHADMGRGERRWGSQKDPVERLQKRNEILEGLVVALREKALAFANEYADFAGKTNYRNRAFREQLDDADNGEQASGEAIRDMLGKVAAKDRRLAASEKQVGDLKEQIVSEASVREHLYSKADAVFKVANSAIEESSRLKEMNEKLVQRLDYQGPKLSEHLDAFLVDRHNKGVAAKEIETLRQKIHDFINVIGDQPVGSYSISDLQRFAHKLTFLPERHKLDRHWRDMGIAEVIAENEAERHPRATYLCEKTILTNYVGRVKTAIRWIAADSKVDYPFENAGNISVMAMGQSVIRHGLPFETVNLLLKEASLANAPEEIWLPLVGLLTGARLGELVYLQPCDVRAENGVYIADLTGQLGQPGRTTRRQLKTVNSRRYVVLHAELIRLGFLEWVAEQGQ